MYQVQGIREAVGSSINRSQIELVGQGGMFDVLCLRRVQLTMHEPWGNWCHGIGTGNDGGGL